MRNAQGQLLAPNGKVSNLNERQWKVVRTPLFQEWFGDWENDPTNASRMLDANGEPRVFWHGSQADIDVFKAQPHRNGLIYFAPVNLRQYGAISMAA